MLHFYYFKYVILQFVIRLNTLFQERERKKKFYKNNLTAQSKNNVKPLLSKKYSR